VGFPIQKSSDQSLFAAPRSLSQRTTSFIASQCQGIHRTPLRHLIALMIDAHPSAEVVQTAHWASTKKKDQLASRFHRDWRSGTVTLGPYTCVQAGQIVSSRFRTTCIKPKFDAKLTTPADGNHVLPGGARRDRTDDLMLAKHALSQLSYGPFRNDDGGPGKT